MPPTSDPDLFDGAFLARLERLRLQVRRRFAGSRQAARRSRRTGSSLEFADYRNYVPGDDPRRIDWSIYGRLERLVLKLTEAEEDLPVAVLIDCSASMFWQAPGKRRSKFDTARRLAAALAYLALYGMDRVELWFFDSTLRGESGCFRSRPAFHEVLRFLREVPAPGRGTDLAESLSRFARRQRRRGLAIVLSDCLDPAGYESGLAALVGRHFDLHLLHLMDPAECEPDPRGDLLLQDCESGTEMSVTAGPALLRAYRKEVEQFREGLKTWCARHHCGYSDVRTDTDFEELVLSLFRNDGLMR